MYSLIETAMSKWITSIFGWLIALVFANGSLVHILNMLGKGEMPWNQFPLLWRTMDVVLLTFNVIVVVGLIFRIPWTVFILFGGLVLLQFLPYTVFRDQFIMKPEDHATLNGLMATEVLILVIYAGLIFWQGRKAEG